MIITFHLWQKLYRFCVTSIVCCIIIDLKCHFNMQPDGSSAYIYVYADTHTYPRESLCVTHTVVPNMRMIWGLYCCYIITSNHRKWSIKMSQVILIVLAKNSEYKRTIAVYHNTTDIPSATLWVLGATQHWFIGLEHREALFSMNKYSR